MQIKQQSTVQQAVNITGFSNPLYSPYYFSPDHDIFSPCQNPAFVSLLTQSTCSQLCLDRSCLSTTTTLTSKLLFIHYPLCPFNLPEQYFLFCSHAILHQHPIQRSLYKYPLLTHVKYCYCKTKYDVNELNRPKRTWWEIYAQTHTLDSPFLFKAALQIQISKKTNRGDRAVAV